MQVIAHFVIVAESPLALCGQYGMVMVLAAAGELEHAVVS